VRGGEPRAGRAAAGGERENPKAGRHEASTARGREGAATGNLYLSEVRRAGSRRRPAQGGQTQSGGGGSTEGRGREQREEDGRPRAGSEKGAAEGEERARPRRRGGRESPRNQPKSDRRRQDIVGI